MNSRERILRAMRQQDHDYVPVSPRMWKFNGVYYGKHGLQTLLKGKQEFDYDPILYTGESVPSFLAPGVPRQEELPAGVTISVDIREEGDFKIVSRRFDTPAGPLTDCHMIPIRGPYDTRTLEYIVKSPEDLPRMRHLAVPPSQRAIERFKKLTAEAGEDVLVCPYVRSPFNDLAHSHPATDSLMLVYDNPEFLRSLLTIYQEACLADIKAHLAAGSESIFMSGFHISLSAGWSPQNYRDFFLPLIKQQVDVTHDGGAVFHFYDDGKVMNILDMLLEVGVDVVSTCTPPPAGDCDLRKAKDMVGDRLTLMGYVDIEHVLHRGTPATVEATVKEAIEIGARDNAFVLSSSDGVLRQTPVENMRAYFAAARRWGKR